MPVPYTDSPYGFKKVVGEPRSTLMICTNFTLYYMEIF